MNKTDIKRHAQDELLHAMSTAFYHIADDTDLSDHDRDRVRAEASRQMARVEKLFGYVPYFWVRG